MSYQNHLVFPVLISKINAGGLQPMWNRLTNQLTYIFGVLFNAAQALADVILVVKATDPDTARGIGVKDFQTTIDLVSVAVISHLHEADELPFEDVCPDMSLVRRSIALLHRRGRKAVVSVIKSLFALGRAHGVASDI